MSYPLIKKRYPLSGANAVEYGLVMAIITALVLGATTVLKVPIEQLFNGTGQCMRALINGGSCDGFFNAENEAQTNTNQPQNPTPGQPQIDYDFIATLEGGLQTDAYYPCPPTQNGCGSSGATISVGFDIGVRNLGDLVALGLPQNIIDLLTPYLERTGQDAYDFLNANPLTITQAQAMLINQQVKEQSTQNLIARYNADSGMDFADIPPQWQTVIASAEYQYGSLQTATPLYWGYVTSQDWTNAIAELRNFGDAFPTRRNAEADYAEQN